MSEVRGAQVLSSGILDVVGQAVDSWPRARFGRRRCGRVCSIADVQTLVRRILSWAR